MPIVCIDRPNRTKVRHFTARDAGRIVASASAEGANDWELIAQIAQGLGEKRTICALAQVLDLFNNALFVGALLGLFKGIQFIFKGLRLIAGGKKSRLVSSFLELIVPKRFVRQLGGLFVWIGAGEAIAAAFVVFLTSIANNVALITLINRSCEVDTPPFPTQGNDVDSGLFEVLDGILEPFRDLKEQAEAAQPERPRVVR